MIMNATKTIFFLMCLAGFCQPSQPLARGWRGIVPLHSTRKDVEQLLGHGKGLCHCEYSLGDGNVSIQYSGEPCTEVRERGWRVPRDTVINISFYPKVNPRFSELPIDKSKYVKRADPEIEGVFSYFNESDGILIEVDGDTVSGFYYTPPKRDDNLRCHSKKKQLSKPQNRRSIYGDGYER